MKKWIPRALGLTAALALVLAAVWLAAGLQPAAPPQPEVQPASRTLITEGELLYDGAALTASDVSLADGAAALADVREHVASGSAVLVKASHFMALEKVVEGLVE